MLEKEWKIDLDRVWIYRGAANFDSVMLREQASSFLQDGILHNLISACDCSATHKIQEFNLEISHLFIVQEES